MDKLAQLHERCQLELCTYRGPSNGPKSSLLIDDPTVLDRTKCECGIIVADVINTVVVTCCSVQSVTHVVDHPGGHAARHVFYQSQELTRFIAMIPEPEDVPITKDSDSRIESVRPVR